MATRSDSGTTKTRTYGIFWSNDAQIPVSRMARSIGVLETEAMLERVRSIYHEARVRGY